MANPFLRIAILLAIVAFATAVSVWWGRKHDGGTEGWGDDPPDPPDPPPAPFQPIPDFIPDSLVEEYGPTKAAA